MELKPLDLTYRHHAILELLEPSLAFKFLTTSWVTALTEYNHNTVQQLLYELRLNGYVEVPRERYRTTNSNYKDYVYQITEKGKRINEKRGVPALKRAHRSKSFHHECVTDMCFLAPLRLLGKKHKLLTPYDVLNHPNVPESTKKSVNPFAIQLKKAVNLDCPPHVLTINGRTFCIPGIQTDRGTEPIKSPEARTTLGDHIDEFFQAMKRRLFETQFGMPDGIVFPIVLVNSRFDHEAKWKLRLESVLNWVEKNHGKSPNLIFKQVPDIADLDHFPKPDTEFITTPWRRVGFPDFSFV